MSSAATGRASRVRLSREPLLSSTVRAWVQVAGRGGKTRWGNGHGFFYVLAQSRLVVFAAEQVVRPAIHHQAAGRFILGVERIQGNPPPPQLHLSEELAG